MVGGSGRGEFSHLLLLFLLFFLSIENRLQGVRAQVRPADERCPGVYCLRNPVSLETRLVEPARIPGP